MTPLDSTVCKFCYSINEPVSKSEGLGMNEEVKNVTSHTSRSPAKNESFLEKNGLITALNTIAGIYLVLGTLGAVGIWITMGITQKAANIPGIILGVGILANSIVVFVILRVFSLIADTLLVIKHNTAK